MGFMRHTGSLQMLWECVPSMLMFPSAHYNILDNTHMFLYKRTSHSKLRIVQFFLGRVPGKR